MTIKINANEKQLGLLIVGDIYQEHAECLCDMIFSHAKRGIRIMDIQLFHTYYINGKGKQCLLEMKKTLESQGVMVTLHTS